VNVGTNWRISPPGMQLTRYWSPAPRGGNAAGSGRARPTQLGATWSAGGALI
jgi:hypothetical protein